MYTLDMLTSQPSPSAAADGTGSRRAAAARSAAKARRAVAEGLRGVRARRRPAGSRGSGALLRRRAAAAATARRLLNTPRLHPASRVANRPGHGRCRTFACLP